MRKNHENRTPLFLHYRQPGAHDLTFAVVNFTLDEALSSLFTLSLTLAAPRSDIDTDTLLLQTAQ
ncbi:hypothetical protein, partial [Photorhabdus sp. RM157S]